MTFDLSGGLLKRIHNAFTTDDAASVRKILDENPALKARINDPIGDFGSPVIVQAKSREMLDVLLDAGADINARSNWGPGGFGLLDSASAELSEYALSRGATLTAHAAARLGKLGELRRMLADDPSLVKARGGDGQMPLHFASTVDVAALLLDNGADIDARDLDHESTAAQWMTKERPAVARYLIGRGAYSDILMASAVGDIDLVRRLLDSDPDAIRMRVSDEYFPMVGGRTGGTIYQWQLGWHVSAVQVARAFGQAEIFDLLMERSPTVERLLNACWLHDEAQVRSLLAAQPDLATYLTPAGRRQLAHAARNNDTVAARLMLEAGLPVDTYSQHHATPLHWAAWHGNAELTRLILLRNPSLEDSTNDYKGTPLNWAKHGEGNSWHPGEGDYAATIQALEDAGAK